MVLDHFWALKKLKNKKNKNFIANSLIPNTSIFGIRGFAMKFLFFKIFFSLGSYQSSLASYQSSY